MMHSDFTAAVNAAEALLQSGDYASAFTAYRRLLAARLTAGEADRRVDWVLTQRVVALAQLVGSYDLANSLLTSLEGRSREHDDAYAADFAATQRVLVLLAADRVMQAYEVVQTLRPTLGDIRELTITPNGLSQWEAHIVWANTDRTDRATLFSLLYLVLGSLLSAFGQYRDARAMFQQGLTHIPNMTDRALRLDHERQILLRDAAAALEAGAFNDALDRLKTPELDLATASIGYQTRWHELWAQCSLLRGLFGEAREHLRWVEQLCQDSKLSRAALLARFNYVSVLITLNQTATASVLLIETEPTVRNSGEQTLQDQYRRLQAVIEARNRLDSAADIDSVAEQQRRARAFDMTGGTAATYQAVTTRPTSFLAAFDDRALSVQFALAQNEYAEAKSHFNALRTAFSTSDSALILARLNALEALVRYYEGDFRGAESASRTAVKHFTTINANADLYQALRIQRQCMFRTGAAPEQIAQLVSTMSAVLDSLVSNLEPLEQDIYLLNKWTDEETTLANTAHALVRSKLPLSWKNWHAYWKRTRDVQELITKLDRRRGLTLDARELRVPLSLHLPLDTAVFAFLTLPDRLFLITQTTFAVDIHELPLPRVRLREEVRALHQALGNVARHKPPQSASAVVAPDPLRLAERLASSLGLPEQIRNLPSRIRRLRIVADDVLHGVPFAALVVDGEPLLTRYSLTHHPYIHSRLAPRTKIRTLLAVAASNGNWRFASLPGTEAELAMITQVVAEHQLKADVLLNPNAKTVVEQLSLRDMAHLACHGIFTLDDPEYTGLVFIPATGDDEDVLSLPTVRTLQLARLQHLVLSACWSADYFALPGRHVVSLPESFHTAGVQTVLGSLWEIGDQVSVAFMRRYYSYLRHLPPDEALRQTQEDTRHNRLDVKLNTSSMRQWASFQLYGNTRRLSFTGSHRWW